MLTAAPSNSLGTRIAPDSTQAPWAPVAASKAIHEAWVAAGDAGITTRLLRVGTGPERSRGTSIPAGGATMVSAIVAGFSPGAVTVTVSGPGTKPLWTRRIILPARNGTGFSPITWPCPTTVAEIVGVA